MGFAPFGRVTSDMDVVESLYKGYGEVAPRGNGPSHNRIEMEGNEYLERHFPRLDYIQTATLIEP
jgi:peptidyl-prolyl cis-trans isomerase A (cyclophilin A)